MKRALLPLLATFAVAACASTPVYGPLSGGYGYTDQRIEDDRFRITYRAKSLPAADDGALRRAAELTVARGEDWFTILSRDSQVERDRRGGSSIGIGGATGGRNSSVGVGVQLPLGGSAAEDATVRLEIRAGSGPKPEGADSYDARAILGNVAG